MANPSLGWSISRQPASCGRDWLAAGHSATKVDRAAASDVATSARSGRRSLRNEGGSRRSIRCRELGEDRAAIASKSHSNQATDDYLAEAIGLCDHVSGGSSLKFCIVAEGEGGVCPR